MYASLPGKLLVFEFVLVSRFSFVFGMVLGLICKFVVWSYGLFFSAERITVAMRLVFRSLGRDNDDFSESEAF